MIFPPHACYLALVRVVKNETIREEFSCLAIFLTVTMVVRLSRNCATQILNSQAALIGSYRLRRELNWGARARATFDCTGAKILFAFSIFDDHAVLCAVK